MRMWSPWVVALVLAGSASQSRPQPPVPGPGAADAAPLHAETRPDFPSIAILASIDGVRIVDPADTLAFVSGLIGAFDADHYLTEIVAGLPTRISMPLHNRFRLARGDPFGDEWQVRVTLAACVDVQGAPGETHRSGLIVSVSTLSPDSAAAGARPIPVPAELVFQIPIEPHADWFSHAGRMVGLLAIESLHHQSGDLEPDARVRLDHTLRDLGARRPPLPGR